MAAKDVWPFLQCGTPWLDRSATAQQGLLLLVHSGPATTVRYGLHLGQGPFTSLSAWDGVGAVFPRGAWGSLKEPHVEFLALCVAQSRCSVTDLSVSLMFLLDQICAMPVENQI